MTIPYQIGDQAKLYYHATAETALLSMTEVTPVMDLTLNLPRGLADITTRANDGFRAQVPTLGEITIEFKLLWSSNSAFITAFRDAWLNRTSLDFAVMSGDRAVAGNEGPRGTFYISEFSRDEPLEDGITHSVTAVLREYLDWEIITT